MRTLIVLLVAVAVSVVPIIGAFAAPLNQFTQNELDTNWEADRQFPSDGATSVSAFGHDDVARIGIDSNETQGSLFRRTEGIKTLGSSNFGDSVQVDLFIDPGWQDKAVRAGFWVVGDDGSGARDQFFGIIEFVNNEPCPESDCTNHSNITDHEGWRTWDSENGWTNRNAAFQYGAWMTLAIELDTDAGEYHYIIGGEDVGTAPGGHNFIREVFLNSYNYGLDNFPNLSSDSYAAHWHHAGLPDVVGESTYVLCVNPRSGQMRSTLSGQCGPGQMELTTPSQQPLSFCINVYTSRVNYTFGRPCPPPHRLHIVPGNGDLLTCVSLFTGINRYAFSPTQCGPFERPNLIPAGYPQFPG